MASQVVYLFTCFRVYLFTCVPVYFFFDESVEYDGNFKFVNGEEFF